MPDFCADKAADLLATQFRARAKATPAIKGPDSRAEAYLVQDRLLQRIGGGIGGWKVGRTKTSGEPYCAPIPLERRMYSPADYRPFDGVALVEAELGFQLARDVPPASRYWDRAECETLVGAIVPALEILETRLASPVAQDPLWKLADLQGNGGLVLGAPVKWQAQDLGKVNLAFGSEPTGAAFEAVHPFGEPLELFCWMVNHAARGRGGLRQGQVIITGSYCGIVEIRAPQVFFANFADFGTLRLNIW